jgi:hypothetical protein
MHSVIANKSTDSIRTMLPSTARNITCDTDIKGAITLAGEDVDARTLLAHSAALAPPPRAGQPPALALSTRSARETAADFFGERGYLGGGRGGIGGFDDAEPQRHRPSQHDTIADAGRGDRRGDTAELGDDFTGQAGPWRDPI